METIGNRISKYRKLKNMTQEDLAGVLGVSSQAVSKWENDQSCPDISLLPELCAVLSITTDELLTGKESRVRLLPAAERKSLDELTLRVLVNSSQGDKIRVNLPMTMVKLALELGVQIRPQMTGVEGMDAIQNVDMGKIVEMVERGMIGKIVEIESVEGDIVEVVVE